jgi:hypothetical protein
MELNKRIRILIILFFCGKIKQVFFLGNQQLLMQNEEGIFHFVSPIYTYIKKIYQLQASKAME